MFYMVGYGYMTDNFFFIFFGKDVSKVQKLFLFGSFAQRFFFSYTSLIWGLVVGTVEKVK